VDGSWLEAIHDQKKKNNNLEFLGREGKRAPRSLSTLIPPIHHTLAMLATKPTKYAIYIPLLPFYTYIYVIWKVKIISIIKVASHLAITHQLSYNL
jgi:hypothetical protein